MMKVISRKLVRKTLEMIRKLAEAEEEEDSDELRENKEKDRIDEELHNQDIEELDVSIRNLEDDRIMKEKGYKTGDILGGTSSMNTLDFNINNLSATSYLN
jgi:hypothetical protein